MIDSVINYTSKNAGAIGQALWQHVEISLIAILITIVIAIPLAVALVNRPKSVSWFLRLPVLFKRFPAWRYWEF